MVTASSRCCDDRRRQRAAPPAAGGWVRPIVVGTFHLIGSDRLLSRRDIAGIIGSHAGKPGEAVPPNTDMPVGSPPPGRRRGVQRRAAWSASTTTSTPTITWTTARPTPARWGALLRERGYAVTEVHDGSGGQGKGRSRPRRCWPR
jgi:hypothetical protein